MLLINVFLWWLEPWNFLSGVMSLIALFGTILNAERNKVGFVFWLISNLYMTVRFFVIGEYAQCILFFIYFLLAIRGISVWSEKDNISEQKEAERKEAVRKVNMIDEYIKAHEKSR